MIVDPIVNPPVPAWRKQSDRRYFEPRTAVSKTSSFGQPDNDIDPDPPPAAPAIRPWPRVFPGL